VCVYCFFFTATATILPCFCLLLARSADLRTFCGTDLEVLYALRSTPPLHSFSFSSIIYIIIYYIIINILYYILIIHYFVAFRVACLFLPKTPNDDNESERHGHEADISYALQFAVSVQQSLPTCLLHPYICLLVIHTLFFIYIYIII